MTLPLTDPTDLVASLGPAERYLVVADLDGTLAPIEDRPEHARPLPGAVEALRALAARTAVAIVSGRPLTELEARFPALAVHLVGGHGAQIREPDGQVHRLVDIDEVAATLDAVEAEVRAAVDDGTGWLVERKAASLAVHHRLVPEDEEAERLPRVRALLETHRDEPPGFDLLVGKAVVELRPDGVDKGRALRWLTERHPRLVPLVLGDDRTDEDAFVTATERGGLAVLVSEDVRPTAATARVADPAAVVAVLSQLAGPSGGR